MLLPFPQKNLDILTNLYLLKTEIGLPDKLKQQLKDKKDIWKENETILSFKKFESQGLYSRECAIHAAKTALSVFDFDISTKKIEEAVELIQGFPISKYGTHTLAIGPAVSKATHGLLQWSPVEWFDIPIWIASGSPVIVGYQPCESWFTQIDKTVRFKNPKRTGGHSMCVVGTSPNAGTIRPWWDVFGIKKKSVGSLLFYNSLKPMFGGWVGLTAWVPWQDTPIGFINAVGLYRTKDWV